MKFLGISEASYRIVFEQVIADPECKKRIESDDAKLRMENEQVHNADMKGCESKVEVRKIYLEKMQAESDLKSRILKKQLPTE